MRKPKIVKYILIGALLFLFSGLFIIRIMFNFDARKEREKQFIDDNPASITFKSSVDQPIRFLSMQFGNGDVIKLSGYGFATIAEPYYINLTKVEFDEASKGNFIIKAECGDKKDWIMDGHKLKREVTPLLDITVFISSCDP